MEPIEVVQINSKSILDLINAEPLYFTFIVAYAKDLLNEFNKDVLDIEKIQHLNNKILSFAEKNSDEKINPVTGYPEPTLFEMKGVYSKAKENIGKIKTYLDRKEFKISNPCKTKDNFCSKYKIVDKDLIQACKTDLENKAGWDAILKATRHLETRIREKSNLSQNEFTTGLADKAFNPHDNKGVLEIPSCATTSEEEGFFLILKGIFQFHKNAKGHREGKIDFDSALQVIGYIDYLLSVIETAKPRDKK
jgi:uncharacterized protein (TIGR02391 family)